MTDREVDASAGDAEHLWTAGTRRMKATINSPTDKEA